MNDIDNILSPPTHDHNYELGVITNRRLLTDNFNLNHQDNYYYSELYCLIEDYTGLKI